MCWKNRLQVSEVGIHLPPVAGMSGQKDIGCQSIVLAGGYEDDTDNGYEFLKNRKWWKRPKRKQEDFRTVF